MDHLTVALMNVIESTEMELDERRAMARITFWRESREILRMSNGRVRSASSPLNAAVTAAYLYPAIAVMVAGHIVSCGVSRHWLMGKVRRDFQAG